MSARYSITLARPCSGPLLDVIAGRFELVDVDCAALVVDRLDQAALRALLILLWDAGHDVVSLGRAPVGSPPR